MHISLKTGHQVLPKKIWLPFIRKSNSYIQLPGSEAQGFTLPGTVGPRLSRLHTRCLSGTTYHSFQQFSILSRRSGCSRDLPRHISIASVYSTTQGLSSSSLQNYIFTLKTNKNLKLFFIKSPTKRRIEVV